HAFAHTRAVAWVEISSSFADNPSANCSTTSKPLEHRLWDSFASSEPGPIHWGVCINSGQHLRHQALANSRNLRSLVFSPRYSSIGSGSVHASHSASVIAHLPNNEKRGRLLARPLRRVFYCAVRSTSPPTPRRRR